MLIFIDTETGGIDPQTHSLLSIGCVAWEQGHGVIDTFEIFIKSKKYCVTSGAQKINKFNEELHNQKAVSQKEAINSLLYFCSKYSNGLANLAGHNTQFDIAFIKKLLRDNRRSFSKHFSHRIVDTYSIIRYLQDADKIELELSSSASAFKHFGITVQGRHTALGDAMATAKLYEKLLELIS